MDNLKIKMLAVTLDCSNADELASFYSALLGWEKGAKPGWAWVSVPGKYPYLLFQEIAGYEPPVWPWTPDAQQQMAHVDFAVNDLEKAVQHAVSCGAVFASEQYSDDYIMLDPAGHPFCLCKKTTIFTVD